MKDKEVQASLKWELINKIVTVQHLNRISARNLKWEILMEVIQWIEVEWVLVIVDLEEVWEESAVVESVEHELVETWVD